MPHLDCVPVAVPAAASVHPAGHADFELGFDSTTTTTKGQQKQQQAKEEAQQQQQQQKAGAGREQQQSRRKTPKGMCQPITEESLSQFQLDKLAELRAQLGEQLLEETPLFNDNFSLLRWLYGWNYRIDEIVPRFKKASSVFRCMRVNGTHFEDIDEVNDFSRTLTEAADYFPGGVLGYDPEGNVVAMQTMGQSHPKQLSKCGRVSDVYRLSVVETAMIYQLIRLQERKRRRKLGLRVIIDLDGFNSDHLTTFGLKVYGSLLKSMQEMFPDMLRQVYVINAHYLVKTAYTIIKPVLSEQSREKVIFLDGGFHEQLAKDIGVDNLFPRWGGTRQPSRGHPQWGTLRVGGVPPLSMRYCPATCPGHMPEEQLKKIVVPARQRREIDVPVPDSGVYILHWFWTGSSDIDFGLLTAEGQEVWPVFRLLTDFVPEHGAERVQGPGSYKFLFDNSFSVFTKKEVKFGFKLVAVEEEKPCEEEAQMEEPEMTKKEEGEEKENGGPEDAVALNGKRA